MQPNYMTPTTGGFDPNAVQAKQKKLIRLIIILVVVTVAVLVLAAVFAPKNTDNEKLSLALARHQEIVRILDEFSQNARSADTKQLVANAKLVVLSGASELSSAGVSVSTTQAGTVKITDIESKLEESIRNNSFDSAITEFITSNLEANRQDLSLVKQDLDDQKRQVVERLLSDYDSLI